MKSGMGDRHRLGAFGRGPTQREFLHPVQRLGRIVFPTTFVANADRYGLKNDESVRVPEDFPGQRLFADCPVTPFAAMIEVTHGYRRS